jgi:hypothetical protein
VLHYGICRYDARFETCTIYAMVSIRGSAGVWFNREHDPTTQPARVESKRSWTKSPLVQIPDAQQGGLLGFRIAARHRPDGYASYVLMLPYWLLILLSAAAPTRAVLRWRRRQIRLASGLCAACGYDLRGSSGRCPECGTHAPSQNRAA